MDEHTPKGKEFAETATSFFHRSGFQYRNQENSIDYGLLRETQRSRIANLFRNQPFFSEERLMAEFEKIEEEGNQFIQSLLDELAIQCKKMRLMQSEHENALRGKNTEGRRLSEKNLELASIIQAERKIREAEKSEMEKQLKDRQRIIRTLSKQSQGLRKLLEEYEGQLQTANEKIQILIEESSKKEETIERMAIKIEQQNQTTQTLEDKCLQSMSQAKDLQEQLSMSKQVCEQLSMTIHKLQDANQRNEQLQTEYSQILKREKDQALLLEHLQMQLLKANGQLMKQEYTYDQLKAASFQKSQSMAQRDCQWKSIVAILQEKTQQSIEKLKENYEKKIKKLVCLLQKEVKSLRQSYQTTKEFMQKEMLLFMKLSQRDFKEKVRALTAPRI